MIVEAIPVRPSSVPGAVYATCRLRQQVFVIEQSCAYPDLDGRDLKVSHPARAA